MKSLTPIEVASTVKYYLKKKGLTQKQLATDAGMSQQWLNKLLSGESYLPETWGQWFEESLGLSSEFLTKGQGPLLKCPPNYDALCQLVRRMRVLQVVEKRASSNWEACQRHDYYTLEEKKKALSSLRKVRAELYEVIGKVDVAISMNENDLNYEVWQQELSM